MKTNTHNRSKESSKSILIAGATGYLGKHAVFAFSKRGYYIRVLARDEGRLDAIRSHIDEAWIGEITDPVSLRGICDGMDYVFSSVGITRQKDGLSYLDVDYRGNRNLMEEALKSRVRSFMYISVFNAEKLKDLEIVEAKELFASLLKTSGLNYVIVRPNGFFSDMEEILKMGRKRKGLDDWLWGEQNESDPRSRSGSGLRRFNQHGHHRNRCRRTRGTDPAPDRRRGFFGRGQTRKNQLDPGLADESHRMAHPAVQSAPGPNAGLFHHHDVDRRGCTGPWPDQIGCSLQE